IDDPSKQIFIHQHIVKQGLSVRKTEEMVRDMQKAPVKKEKRPGPLSFQVQKIQDDLASKFSTRVKLKMGNQGKGVIEIPFLSENDLSRILEMLDWQKRFSCHWKLMGYTRNITRRSDGTLLSRGEYVLPTIRPEGT